jgi:hypothetical protein
MASYKEGNEKLNNTGSGLTGLDLSTLQEYVVNNICKYYYVLDPVLRDRPNVRPVYTNDNEDDDSDGSDLSNHDAIVRDCINLSSDEESLLSLTNADKINKNRYSNLEMSEMGNDNEYDTISTMSPSSQSKSNNHSSPVARQNNIHINTDDICTQITASPKKSSPKRKKSTSTESSITPMEAKQLQRSLLNKKKNLLQVRRQSQCLGSFRRKMMKIETTSSSQGTIE